RYLRERIERLSKSDPGKFALLLVDLDNFKKVNDIHGHVVGDDVLIAAAASIRETCPPDASCVRLGGDEFAVLVSGVSAREGALSGLAARLVSELRKPVRSANIVTTIGASIGIALASRKCRNPGDLLKRADVAMYAAKHKGRGTF